MREFETLQLALTTLLTGPTSGARARDLAAAIVNASRDASNPGRVREARLELKAVAEWALAALDACNAEVCGCRHGRACTISHDAAMCTCELCRDATGR